MTVALVLAAEPAAGLRGQLTSLGVRRVDATDEEGSGSGLLTIAAAARVASEPVLICGADLAVPRQALARLLGTEGTVGYAEARAGCRAVLVDRSDLRALADAAEYLASRPGAADDVSALIGELARRGATVKFVEARPDGDADRDEDGLVAELFADPIARDVARWAAERALAPVALLGISLSLGLTAAVWFTEPIPTARAAGAVALLAAFVSGRAARVLASAPGPVLEALGGIAGRAAARLPGAATLRPAGDWLSAACWAITECAVYAGLAASAGLDARGARGGILAGPATIGAGPGGVWHLAVAAMAVMAVRRMIDLCYERAAERSGGRIRIPRSARRRRIERSLALPAGERAVLLILAGSIAGPKIAFLALIGWGVIAAGYVVTARLVGLRDTAAYGPQPGHAGPAGLAGPAVALATDQGAIGLDPPAARVGLRSLLGSGDPDEPADRDGGTPRTASRPHPAPAAPRPAVAYGVAAYRDDGPLSLWLGRLVEGRLPPMFPAIVGVFVTSALAALGMGNLSGVLVLTPVEAMLLAGLGSGHPHDGRYDWLVPPLLQAGEYLFLASLAFTRLVAPPVVFALLAAVFLRHLDVAYRARHRIAWPRLRAAAHPQAAGRGPWTATAAGAEAHRGPDGPAGQDGPGGQAGHGGRPGRPGRWPAGDPGRAAGAPSPAAGTRTAMESPAANGHPRAADPGLGTIRERLSLKAAGGSGDVAGLGWELR
ncbi:MAG TPA: DUF5941 domain-containing protein, partial [Streptosporangiaceae bacterium]|nr:DUF5941 domain-containing protein [Streptosporangiaceae bacterium]